MGIEYRKDKLEIVGFSDSDFSGDLGDIKSTTGFLIRRRCFK